MTSAPPTMTGNDSSQTTPATTIDQVNGGTCESRRYGVRRAIAVVTTQIVPSFEMFNTFNNANNVNPLSTPALFNFDGFLRTGVGDPRQVQLAIKMTF